MKDRAGVLYVQHKSITEPIPRLHGLDQVHALSGTREFSVISFEPSRSHEDGDSEYNQVRLWLRNAGIDHHSLGFFPNRWLDILVGTLKILQIVTFGRVRILHCRSYIPALMGLLAQKLTSTRLVFDMRGLFVDEYVFEGAFREGSLKEKFARWLERRLLFHADSIIVVSNKFRHHILTRPDIREKIQEDRIRVIPNRTILSRFEVPLKNRETLRRDRDWQDKTVAVFAGSTSPWHLVDTSMVIMKKVIAKRPDAHFAIITYPSTEKARALGEEIGLPEDRVTYLTARPDEIPEHLVACDLGFVLVAKHVSKEVCAPIKLGEYLAAGNPLVGGGGIGDAGEWIEDHEVGLIVDPDFADDAANRILSFLDSDEYTSGRCRERCLSFAREHLDMDETLRQYDSVYKSLEDQ